MFIDRKLAGAYGSARGLYMRPPFQNGTKQQGQQSPLTPSARYPTSPPRSTGCRAAFVGNPTYKDRFGL